MAAEPAFPPSDAPDWANTIRVHDWRNYINDALREMWPTFTPEQRAVLARNAQDIADGEAWD